MRKVASRTRNDSLSLSLSVNSRLFPENTFKMTEKAAKFQISRENVTSALREHIDNLVRAAKGDHFAAKNGAPRSTRSIHATRDDETRASRLILFALSRGDDRK